MKIITRKKYLDRIIELYVTGSNAFLPGAEKVC